MLSYSGRCHDKQKEKYIIYLLLLILEVLIATAEDDILISIHHFFSQKIRIDISDELSAEQTICIKCQPYLL